MRCWVSIAVLLCAFNHGGCSSSPVIGGGDGTDSSSTPEGGDSTVGLDESGGSGPVVESMFELRLNLEPPAPLTLEMNKEEVAELFGDRASDILLLEIDSSTLLRNTLTQVRDACGDAWQNDAFDPNPDCSRTALGQTFMGPDGTWQSSAEYAMVRLLTMTPANIDVSGTSSEGLQEIANGIPLVIPDYGEILAQSLGIARTDTIISTDAVVESFRLYFAGSHPATSDEGALRFTLGDALTDLASLTARYGPQGDHPGLLDPNVPVMGTVFGPQFKMTAIAESNLRLVDGIDASGIDEGSGKGFALVIDDKVGPTFDDELEFDFADPQRFQVEGIVEDLRIAMRFSLTEGLGFVPSCIEPGCPSNLPGAPTTPQSVWGLDPWLFEFLVTYAGYLDYRDLVQNLSFSLGAATVAIGQDGNPPGWVHYQTLFDLGNPPSDQYLWETILEVSQVRLHDSGFATFPEGVTLAFTVEDIPVGLTGTEAAEAVRPYLQEQASSISDFLLGDFHQDNDSIDFSYRQAEDGHAYIYFVAPRDRGLDELPAYSRPGLFFDAALTDKASSTTIDGVLDTEHEKLALSVGQSFYYFEDDTGNTYRVRFIVDGDDTTIDVGIGPIPE